MADKGCGKHTELVTNEHVRITQCTCGVVHLTYLKNGVTLRMTEEALRQSTRGLLLATDQLDEVHRVRIN